MSHRDSLIKKNKELSKPMDLMNVGFVGAAGGKAIMATGGTENDFTSGGVDYRVHKFTSDSTFEILAASLNINAVIVAGGGGGGAGDQNGGGGGGSQQAGTANTGGGGGGGAWWDAKTGGSGIVLIWYII